jgi:DNA primase
MKIPQEFIELIKRDVSIVEVAEDYFKLHKTGTIFQANCIHEGGDKTPSLTFFSDTNSFHCFGCGAGSKQKTDGSDIVSFVMWVDNCSFPEAVARLANKKGLKVPSTEMSADDKKKAQIMAGTLEMNRNYWTALQEQPVVLDYLNNRGIGKEEVDKFRIGWVPFEDPQKVAGRLAFAIMNDWGQTVGFSFRNMEEFIPHPISPDTGPKYVNSPKSLVFDKGSLLYGLNFVKRMIREKDYVVVAEGFGDTILGQKYNCPFVSIMGTSLTAEHIKILSKYTKNIYVWLDGDAGGVAAALRHLTPLRAEGLMVKVIYTPGCDPDDVCMQMGEHLEQFIKENAVLAGQFEIDLVMGKFRSDMAELKFKAIAQVRAIIQAIPSAQERQVYANHIAHELSVEPNILLQGSE